MDLNISGVAKAEPEYIHFIVSKPQTFLELGKKRVCRALLCFHSYCSGAKMKESFGLDKLSYDIFVGHFHFEVGDVKLHTLFYHYSKSIEFVGFYLSKILDSPYMQL